MPAFCLSNNHICPFLAYQYYHFLSETVISGKCGGRERKLSIKVQPYPQNPRQKGLIISHPPTTVLGKGMIIWSKWKYQSLSAGFYIWLTGDKLTFCCCCYLRFCYLAWLDLERLRSFLLPHRRKSSTVGKLGPLPEIQTKRWREP